MKLMKKLNPGCYFCILPDDIKWTYKSSLRFDDTGNVVHTFTTDDYLVDVKVDSYGEICSIYACPKEYYSVLTLGVILAGVNSKVSIKTGYRYNNQYEVQEFFDKSMCVLEYIIDLVYYLGEE